jgi:hypothetical protein
MSVAWPPVSLKMASPIPKSATVSEASRKFILQAASGFGGRKLTDGQQYRDGSLRFA